MLTLRPTQTDTMKLHLPTTLMASMLAVATAVTLSSCGDKEETPAKGDAAPAAPAAETTPAETPAAEAPAAEPAAAPAPVAAAPAANAALPLGSVKSWDDAKARVNSEKRYGKSDKEKVLKAIEAVQGGADINKTAVDTRNNLLGFACNKNDYDMAAFLLSQGADLTADADVKRPATPFVNAFEGAEDDDYKLAEALITSGLVQPNQLGAENRPLLCVAAENRNLPLAKLLVEKGADVNLTDGRGRTALFDALNTSGIITLGPSSTNVAQFLLDNGAKTDIVDKEGMTILMACAGRLTVDMIEVLVEKGADLKAVDSKGKGFGIYLCDSGNKVKALEILKALGDRVDVVTPDKSGWNTVFVAGKHPKGPEAAPLVQYLIERGADPKATWKTTGETCLHHAVDNYKDKTPEVAELLIKAGADVNAVSNGGINPAMFCMKHGGSPMNLDCLLKNGTDVNAKDKKGLGLWDYAEKYSKPNCDFKAVLEANSVPKP